MQWGPHSLRQIMNFLGAAPSDIEVEELEKKARVNGFSFSCGGVERTCNYNDYLVKVNDNYMCFNPSDFHTLFEYCKWYSLMFS